MVDEIAFEKLMTVVRRLSKLTLEKRALWEDTEQPDTFLYSLPTTSVMIASRDADSRHPFVVRVLDEAGDVVETLVTSEEGSMPWEREIAELHTLAKRVATDADKVLDQLLAELPPEPDPWGR